MAFGIDIDINAQVFKAGEQIKKISGDLDRFAQKAESMSSKVNRAFAALGVGVSVAGMAAFVKNGIDSVDMLNDLADRTGVSVENLSKFRLAVELGDTNLETFGKSLNKLSIEIAKNGEAFAALGITAKDPLEAFIQLADVFNAIEDPQQRAAFGAKAMGRSYAEMAPLLKMGAEELRRLAREGEQFNLVTTEQARKAAEFNDALARFAAQTQGFREGLALNIIEPIGAIAEAMNKAIERSGVLKGALDGLIAGYRNFSFEGAIGLTDELDQVNLKIGLIKKRISDLKSDGGWLGDYKVKAEEETLNQLLTERFGLIQKISAQRKKDSPAASGASPDAIKDFIAPTQAQETQNNRLSDSVKRLTSVTKARTDQFQKAIEQLQFELSITGEIEEQQQLLLEIRSATAGASAAEASEIERLIRLKYEETEINDILSTGNRLALDQQREMTAQRQLDIASYRELKNVLANGLDAPLSPGNERLNAGIATAQNAYQSGIIEEPEYKETLDQLGQDFNKGVLEPGKGALAELSVFAEQAARNIQDAFADFLFNPFEEGLDGLLKSFVETMGKMAANAAASELLELLKPAVSAGVSGLFGLFGGGVAAANGAIMTSAGPLPLSRYSTGGIATRPQVALFGEGRMNEAYVPLPDGRSIPVTMKGGAGQVINNNEITVNVTSTGRESPEQLGQKVSESIVRAIARQEIQSAARPGNHLNKTTSFG